MEKKDVRKYFVNQLNDKNSNIAKDDIFNLALECGLNVKPRLAKSKIIDMMVEEGNYDRLFEAFGEFVTVPCWSVADYYNMSTSKINQLKTIGVIKEEPIQKEFYSRRDKQYYNADTYPLSVLEYNPEELLQAYNKAYGGNTHSLRIETKTKEEVKELINVLQKVFKVERVPDTYEHRNGDGYYTYFKVKLLNNTAEEENRLLAEISQFKEEQEQLKREHNEHIDRLLKVYKTYLGEDLTRFNVQERLDNLVREGVCKSNEPPKNARGAGRKPLFTKNEIMGMEIMRENGYSYNAIAKEYSTTKATVMNYLKKKKKSFSKEDEIEALKLEIKFFEDKYCGKYEETLGLKNSKTDEEIEDETEWLYWLKRMQE